MSSSQSQSQSQNNNNDAVVDPNRWIKDTSNPINNQWVKISGVVSSRGTTLNGQIGVVVQYNNTDNKDRYVVVLFPTESNTANQQQQPQQQVSIKRENLVAASFVETWRTKYRALIQPQIQPMITKLQRATGLQQNPMYLGGGIVAIVAMLVYLLGFSRTVMLFSFSFLVYVIVYGPNVQDGTPRSGPPSVRSSAKQLRDMIRQAQMPFLDKIAANDYALATIVIVVVVFFVSTMIPPRVKAEVTRTVATSTGIFPTSWWTASSNNNNNVPTTPQPAVPGTTASSSRGLLTKQQQQQEYYKLGFDDATNMQPYGHSLQQSLQQKVEVDDADHDVAMDGVGAEGKDQPPRRRPHREEGGGGGGGYDDEEEEEWTGSSPRPRSPQPQYHRHQQSKPRNNLFTMSTVMSVFFLYRTASELFFDGTTWSIHRFRQVWPAYSKWKLIMLGFSLYRLLKAIMMASS